MKSTMSVTPGGRNGEPIKLEDRRQEWWTRSSQRDWSTNAAVDEVIDIGELAHLALYSLQEEQCIKATVDTGAGPSAFLEHGGYC